MQDFNDMREKSESWDIDQWIEEKMLRNQKFLYASDDSLNPFTKPAKNDQIKNIIQHQ